MIPWLNIGDRVAIVATARAVSPEEMEPAVRMLSSWGLEVVVPEGLYERQGQLAGCDAHRAEVLQRQLDDPTVRAIVCARGGYGTVRIVDRLGFEAFSAHPKWVVGYSDATVLHSHINATLGLPTLHATMPINFPADGKPCEATESLREALFGRWRPIGWGGHPLDRPGHATGRVVGGNLSILYSLLGSRSQIDTRDRLLLIEDLDEYLYHIDRMMQALRRAGMLEGLAGLIVGGMSDMHDNAVPFGCTAEEIVREAVEGYGYPVAFGAPVGHLGTANRALPLGIGMRLTVGAVGQGSTLTL